MPPDVKKPPTGLLTQKKGPLPVWAWAGLGLAGAYAYSRYKAGKTSSSTSTATTAGTAAVGEPAGTPPDFVIENNLPGAPASIPAAPAGAPTPSTPITPGTPLPVVTPPNTVPWPPILVKPPVPPTPAPPGKAPSPAPPPVHRGPLSYVVVTGDNLSSIAAKHGTSASALYAYNTTPGNRPAATIATLKQRGPDLIFPGETILIPQ